MNNALDIAENDQFFFDNSEISVINVDEEGEFQTTKLAPGIYLNLNKDFFKRKLLGATIKTS
ncbi:hypothetical protein H9X57_09470 [Flavobacterium piscinae]|uniref:hypothetical protein n=1 Tax=Flavobacterium piscinae TaxID=2506424 RepID=UPI00199EB778|nr:hypothetical protein [Flavobacterium piscinae]MBC8883537.1 hypothetical protein [Flavobacterium piscinae]